VTDPAPMAEPHLSVAAPCFNEAESIAAVVAEWDRVLDGWDKPSEIVLCNDGSTDGTAAILEQVARRHPRLRVVSFHTNGGYGRALGAAIAATRGAWVATIDSDGQFDLADGLSLLAAAEQQGLDCMTGYRRAKQAGWLHVFGDRVLNRIVRWMFSIDLRDTNCALKVARGPLLRGLRIEARGYPTPTEIVVRLAARGCRLGEAGVSHRERAGGASKLHPWRTGWNFLRFLFYLRRKLKLHRARIIVEP
jgi:dolichol-phosphate mannosyltransferase